MVRDALNVLGNRRRDQSREQPENAESALRQQPRSAHRDYLHDRPRPDFEQNGPCNLGLRVLRVHDFKGVRITVRTQRQSAVRQHPHRLFRGVGVYAACTEFRAVYLLRQLRFLRGWGLAVLGRGRVYIVAVAL